MRFIAIDPSIRSCGVALFKDRELRDYQLISTKDITSTHWTTLAHRMLDRLEQYLYQSSFIISEFPREFGSARGQAALNTGAVRKLAYMVGLIGGWAKSNNKGFLIFEPHEWKGNLPKAITLKRVLRDFPQVSPGTNHNVIDAIGIGRHYIKYRYKLVRRSTL